MSGSEGVDGDSQGREDGFVLANSPVVDSPPHETQAILGERMLQKGKARRGGRGLLAGLVRPKGHNGFVLLWWLWFRDG